MFKLETITEFSSGKEVLRLLFFLTCFFDVCTFLVQRGAQCGHADVQHANLIHTVVKHPQRVLLLLIIMTEDLTIDEGGKHLRLQET